MKPIAVGACEACNIEGDLFQAPGSSYHLCVKHYQAEVAAIESSKVINKVVVESLKIDSNIKLKADIFNASTTSFIELHAAIMHDESIPADKKNETLVKMCEERIKHHTDVIFNLDEKKMMEQNAREGWRKSTMDFISNLRDIEREKYKKFNISYTPAVVTKTAVKGRAPKITKAKVGTNLAEARRMGEKYGVPYLGIQSLVVARNISYEDAAKELCKMLQKPLPV